MPKKPMAVKDRWLRMRTGITILAVLVVTLVAGLCLLLFAESHHKAQVKKTALTAQAQAQLAGSVTYQALEDQGCQVNRGNFFDAGDIGGGECTFVARTYYSTTSDLAAVALKADEQLRQHGWAYSYAGQDLAGVKAAISQPDWLTQQGQGNSSVVLEYKNSRYAHVLLTLAFYDPTVPHSGDQIKALIDAKKLSAPPPGYRIYGLELTAYYWSCSNTSFFSVCVPPLAYGGLLPRIGKFSNL